MRPSESPRMYAKTQSVAAPIIPQSGWRTLLHSTMFDLNRDVADAGSPNWIIAMPRNPGTRTWVYVSSAAWLSSMAAVEASTHSRGRAS